MKLNPFRKTATSGHYQKLKAEYAELTQQFDTARKALDDARRVYDERTQASHALEARSPERTYLSDAEIHLRRLREEARQHLTTLEREVSDLQLRHDRLRSTVEAPARMAESRLATERLVQQRLSLQADLDKSNAVVAKLEKRIAELERRLVEQTALATTAIAEADGEVSMPESLTKLDVELRVTQAALVEVQQKAQALAAEIQVLPNQIRQALHHFVGNRATVAEIELLEQMPAFIEVIARAAVARNQCRRGDANRYEIEIPREIVDAMEATLAAELPQT